jgi:hypothetical protein
MTLPACAQEASTPIWPGTPEFKPLWSEPPRKKPQVRGWVRHSPPARTIIKRDVVAKPEKIEARCKPSVAATGDSAKSETAAKLESQKAWKGEVQWQYGNMYLDLQNAEDISYQCGPSSVPRYGGTVEATVSKFLPIESITCRVKASPCAVPVQKDNGK